MTFGSSELLRGINFLVAVIGLFGISEILLTMEERLALRGHAASISLRVVLQRVEGAAALLGDAAALLGHRLLARHHARRRDRGVVHGLQPRQAFLQGQGELRQRRIEGVFAPETAAHASGTAALLPMLALGIPGSGTAAILLGGLMVWGLNPGPLLFVEHKDFVWGLIASMYLGNIVGLVLVLTTVPIFAAVLRVPFAAIAPMIVVSCAIGAYAIQNAMFDIWLMLAFGVVGYVFKKIGIPLAPFTLALVLGSRAEDSFRLSMIGAGGDLGVSGRTASSARSRRLHWCCCFGRRYRPCSIECKSCSRVHPLSCPAKAGHPVFPTPTRDLADPRQRQCILGRPLEAGDDGQFGSAIEFRAGDCRLRRRGVAALRRPAPDKTPRAEEGATAQAAARDHAPARARMSDSGGAVATRRPPRMTS